MSMWRIVIKLFLLFTERNPSRRSWLPGFTWLEILTRVNAGGGLGPRWTEFANKSKELQASPEPILSRPWLNYVGPTGVRVRNRRWMISAFTSATRTEREVRSCSSSRKHFLNQAVQNQAVQNQVVQRSQTGSAKQEVRGTVSLRRGPSVYRPFQGLFHSAGRVEASARLRTGSFFVRDLS